MDDIFQSVAIGSDPSDLRLHHLFARLKGRVIGAGQLDYDRARALAVSNRDDRPAFIIQVADAGDVAVALEFARTSGMEVAVRSGGHSIAGHGANVGGLVIDVRGLDTLELDADKTEVWVGSGLTAGAITRELEKHGLILGFGDSGSVGVGGLTLGGGIGYLVRKHGLTIDSLLAVELVTAAGDVLIADENHHPDLFWALRGGGGNFGVVTRFRFRLHPLPEFVGGPLVMPATPEVLAGIVAASAAAPDELTTIVQAMPAPPLPFLPPEAIGRKVIIAMMAFAGPASDAEKALAPFRALAKPLADLVGPAPLSALYIPEEEGPPPAVSVRSTFVEHFDAAQAARMIDLLDDSDAPMRMAQVRVLGGAAARVPAGATAFAHRHAPILMSFLAMDAPANLARNEAWVARGLGIASQGGDLGAYVNFLADEGDQRVRKAYPQEVWDRLRKVKRQYDPQNLFHLNQNIPPARPEAA